jgi:hypothetical protein
MSVLIGGFFVITLLLLAGCAKEQTAVPIGNTTVIQAAPAQQDAPSGTAAETADEKPVKKAETPVTILTETTQPPAANKTDATENATSAQLLINGCIDTDYGKNYKMKGSVQYREGNVSIIKTDDCIGGELREWYCDKGELAKEIYICSKGCLDGACS